MARKTNQLETVALTVSITRTMKTYLDILTESGVYGKNAAETANLVLNDFVRKKIAEGELPKAAELNHFTNNEAS